MSDHVPDERYAKFMLLAGTAAIALAVSCPVTATTFTLPRPVMRCSSGVSVPIVVPGVTMRPKRLRFIPSARDAGRVWWGRLIAMLMRWCIRTLLRP